MFGMNSADTGLTLVVLGLFLCIVLTKAIAEIGSTRRAAHKARSGAPVVDTVDAPRKGIIPR